MREAIVNRAYDVFRADIEPPPAMTLRAGNALDSYESPPAYDATIDQPTDAYLAAHTYWGLVYLDAASWRHYLPHLIAYTFRHTADQTTMVAQGLLFSLRPPDLQPPRLATLTPEQEALIVAFLENLAFSDDSGAYQDDALQILEEWWLPNALYRNRPNQAS